MYNNFSYYYDKMMENMDYAFFVDLAEKYLPKKARILDAGCGTGTISLALFKEGYQVCGIDNSSEMLMIFQEKMRKEKINIPLFENSIEEDLPPLAFEAVISFLDVINYVDYQKAFKNIYNTLTFGGVFLFDVDQVSYVQGLDGYYEEEEYSDFSYSWKVDYLGNNDIKHHLVIRNNNGEVFEEEHYQKTYPIETYIKELESLGFEAHLLDETDEMKAFIMAIKKSE